MGIPSSGFAYVRGVETESRRKLVADAAGGAAALSTIETKGRDPLVTATFFASVHRIAAALCAAILIVSTAAPVSAATLLVDDDSVQCPTAPYTTIQAAVAASSAGDTVKLCAGLYGGQVVITHPLKIFGKAPNPETCNTLAPLSPTAHSIFDAPAVAGPGGIGIDVLADNVTIQDVVFRGAGEAAVRTDPAYAKFQLKFSVFTLNANGLYFHSAGTTTSSVKDNCFHQNGTGIRAGYGLKKALIQKNYFFGSNVGAGIILDQLSATTNEKLKIQSNRSMNDATFAVIVGTVDSTVAKNKILGKCDDRHGHPVRRQQLRPGGQAEHGAKPRDQRHPLQHAILPRLPAERPEQRPQREQERRPEPWDARDHDRIGRGRSQPRFLTRPEEHGDQCRGRRCR